MKTVLIVQCRLSSTRLPRKALLSLDGKTLLEWNLCAMKKVPVDEYVLAVDYDSEKELAPVAEKCEFKIYAGPKEDVLQRFCGAINEFHADVVLRSTADNPFLFYEAASCLVEEFNRRFETEKIDYMTYTGLPHGSGVEIFNAHTLLQAAQETQDPYDHEHVGPALYNHKDKFNSVFESAAEEFNFPELRSTIDTYEDYRRALRVIQVNKNLSLEPPYSAEQIVSALKTEEVSRPILFVPSTQESRGTGHLRRCLSLAKETLGDIYIPCDASLKECNELVEEAIANGLNEWQIVRELKSLSQYALAVFDMFRSDKDLLEKISGECAVLALDEGQENLSSVDYYLDVIPSVSQSRKVNLVKPDFMELPENRKTQKLDSVKNALVCFGGEDPAGLTMPCSLELLKLKKDVTVIASGTIDQDLLLKTASEFDAKLCIEKNIPKLKEELYKFDLVMSHYGFTAFESRAAGCITILGATSPYHKQLSETQNFLCLEKTEIKTQTIASAIQKLLSSQAETFSSTKESLSSFIRNLAQGKKLSCPICHSNAEDSHTRFQKTKVAARTSQRTFCTCGTCSMQYISWTAKSQETKYNHEYFFQDYQKQYGKTYLEDFDSIKAQCQRRLSNIQKVSRNTQKAKVLDIGCAMGPFLSAARDLGLDSYGTDICDEAVEYVRDQLKIPCVKAAFPNFSSKDSFGIENFDVVSMWYVIEHFQNLDEVLRGVNALLKKGGVFAFSTPNASGVSAKYNTQGFYESSPSDHFSLWEVKKAKGILKKFGFRLVKIVPTGIHPERFPEFKENGWKIGGKEYEKLAKISRKGLLGDTFELYAKKIR